MKALAHIRTINEKQVTLGLFAGIGLLFIVYGFFVNATIVNIVGRKDAENSSRELISKVTNLEVEYGKLQKSISYEYAESIGFTRQDEQVFAQAQQLVKNVSLGF